MLIRSKKALALVALLAASSAFAQNAKVSTLIPVMTPLTGSELFYVVQGGVSKNMTFSALQQALSVGSFSSLTVGPSQASYGQILQVTATYPGLLVNADVVRTQVGGFPTTDEITGSGVNSVSAIAGAVTIPAGSNAGPFDAGVSGYCQTKNATRACVGLYGDAQVLIAGSSGWGVNTTSLNCEGHGVLCGPGNGLNFSLLYGYEADLDVYTTATGAPIGQGFGIFATYFANTVPTGGAFAFTAGLHAFSVSHGVKWTTGYTTQDGGATTGVEIGATAAVAANLASQPILFNWYNGSSALGLVNIHADSTGNLNLNTNLVAQSASITGTGAFLNNQSSGGRQWLISSSGSSSTGGAGNLGFTDITDSVNAITVLISGSVANFGIDTTAPTAPLHVHAATNQNLLVQINSGLTITANNDANNANVPLNIAATALSLNATTATFSGSALSKSPSGGVGYATGAGGTVTQATSKSTGVALNKLSGAITTTSDALAAGAIVSFVLTDTSIAATDTLSLNHISGGTIGAYTLNAAAAAGSATIYVRNATAGSLSEAITIEFNVIKGVTS